MKYFPITVVLRLVLYEGVKNASAVKARVIDGELKAALINPKMVSEAGRLLVES